ncbi:MAG: WYL domain-containing protein [Verrucomicrobiia bacterium]
MNTQASFPTASSPIDKSSSIPSRRHFLGILAALTCAPLLPALVPRSRPARVGNKVSAGANFQIVPAEDRTALDRWKSARRTPVRRSQDPRLNALIQEVESGRTLQFHYRGGSEPFAVRTISPTAIYFVDDFHDEIYLTGYDHQRGGARTFRLDRISNLEPLA